MKNPIRFTGIIIFVYLLITSCSSSIFAQSNEYKFKVTIETPLSSNVYQANSILITGRVITICKEDNLEYKILEDTKIKIRTNKDEYIDFSYNNYNDKKIKRVLVTYNFVEPIIVNENGKKTGFELWFDEGWERFILK